MGHCDPLIKASNNLQPVIKKKRHQKIKKKIQNGIRSNPNKNSKKKRDITLIYLSM